MRVRVHATALNPADYKVAQGQMTFLHARTFPLVLGYDFSGVVDAVGSGVAGLERGVEVFGFLAYGPFNRDGAFAEMLLARADRLAPKPAAITHAEAAAAATPALTALQSLRDLGRVRGSGMRVVVTGTSGGVGSFGVAIAHRLGATVIAIGSGSGLARATALGADRVIDRTAGNPLTAVGEPVDLFFDAAAAYRWRAVRRSLRPGAAYVTTLPSAAFVVDKLTSLAGGPRCEAVMVKAKPDDLRTLGAWLADGMSATIDSTISLAEIPTALERFERGAVQGRIVVAIP